MQPVITVRDLSRTCQTDELTRHVDVSRSPSNSLRVSSSLILRVARLASSFSVLYFSYSTSFVLILSNCKP